MLRYNFAINSAIPARQWGATIALSRYLYSRTELKNYTASEGFENNKAGIPFGHLAPSSWVLPQSPGGISAYEELIVSFTSSLAPGTLTQIVGNTAITVTPSANILGIGVLSGAVTPFTPLSPESLADAVWSANTAEYSTTGSTGKFLYSTKLNSDLIPAAL
jgi:hypothetical protein